MVEVRYRPGTAGDVPAMYALDVICFEEPFRFSLRAMRRFALTPGASVWVAEVEGALAGFVIVEAEGEAGYVVTLDVAPKQRRLGVAGELMRLAQDGLASAGVKSLALHVYVGNSAAVRFYEKLGFSFKANEAGFYGAGLDAHVYGRALALVDEVCGG